MLPGDLPMDAVSAPHVGAAATGPPLRRWRQVIKTVMLRALPRRLLLATGPPGRPGVYLTFDDGPHPEYTPQLLDLLGEHGAPATFFVIGACAERHPGLVRRMAAEGHTVGHHTYSHAVLESLSLREGVAEIRKAQAVLRSILGRAPTLFRPPQGRITGAKLLWLWLQGQTVVLWSNDPRDYSCRGPEELVAWFESHPPRTGDIILLHENRPHMLGLLPALIAETRRRGETFRRLEDPGQRDAGGAGA